VLEALVDLLEALVDLPAQVIDLGRDGIAAASRT